MAKQTTVARKEPVKNVLKKGRKTPVRIGSGTVNKHVMKQDGKDVVLTIRLSSDTDWARPLRMREANRIMRNSSLEMNVFSQVVYMSLQQLKARIADNALLEAVRAERVKLVEQLVERSREVYGDKGKADRWMLRPSAYLGNKAPVEKLGSMAGIAEVMTELERIDASAFA